MLLMVGIGPRGHTYPNSMIGCGRFVASRGHILCWVLIDTNCYLMGILHNLVWFYSVKSFWVLHIRGVGSIFRLEGHQKVQTANRKKKSIFSYKVKVQN